ncbi:MAG: Mur ligase family protein, partial [Verrucomicrobiota bacterium]
MKETDILTISEWSGGDLLQGIPAQTVSAISTDTRALRGGELFVALKGERFDAHDYLDEAVAAGAGALLVQELPKVTETFSLPIIRVRDSLLGLQELARNYRRSLSIPVVGITGSSGKTSTKDLLRAVFEKQGLVNATHGNLNNHIGLPLSVLNTSGRDEFAVFEMGMSHPGEIERLAEIAQPTAGVITCIGTAHLGQMGSQEAIAEEKGMLVEAIRSDGFVVLPANDPF